MKAPGDIWPRSARAPFEFLFAFRCSECGKEKQVVRVGLDAGGRMVLEHPFSADCDGVRYYARTRSLEDYVRRAVADLVNRAAPTRSSS